MMHVLAPRRTSLITFAAIGLAALMLLLSVRAASADMSASAPTPASGPTAGGFIITIPGTDFPDECASPAVTVTIGDAPAPLQAPISETEIKVFAPAHVAGTVDIVIDDNCSDDQDTILDAFTYVDSPEAIGLAPETGSVEGGTEVTIFGNHFEDGATVTFGGTAATAVDFVSEHELIATAPAGTGTVDVTVTNPDDQETTLEDAFTYGAAEPGEGEIVSGDIPPTGFGLFVFGGGTNAQLVTASGCPQTTVTFYATNSSGGFVVYIPGSGVAAVNAAWNALFSNDIPELQPLIGKCA